MQLIVQPLFAVLNPELMPLLLAFLALRNDDSIHALENIMNENLKAMEVRKSIIFNTKSIIFNAKSIIFNTKSIIFE